MIDTDLIRETFSKLAPRYEEAVDFELKLFWGWSYKEFVHKYLTMTPFRDDVTILEVATGTGVIPRAILEKSIPHKKIHALDITYAMLQQAKNKNHQEGYENTIELTCASAMQMPYPNNSFSLVMCGLAVHHMDVRKLFSEIYRVLANDGCISIADVGGSPIWKIPIVRFFIQIGSFIFYLIKEDMSRARAEAAGAPTSIQTSQDWHDVLCEAGFENISIMKLKSKYSWIPKPIIIQATKNNQGG